MTPPSLVRVGLAGCGRIGALHARALRAADAARLVGVVDLEPQRSAAVAGESGARVFPDLEALIAAPDIDAVLVALPTHLHAPVALQAIRAGKHVLCEKPMAADLDSADQMLAAAAAHGVVLMVGHDLRFSRCYREVRDAVASGRIGRPLAFTAERLSGAAGTTWHTWIRRAGEGSGAFDALVHDLDVALWLIGPVAEVHADGSRGPGGTWDDVHVLLRHVNGCSSAIGASLLVPPGFPFTSSFRIVGEAGTLSRRFVGGPSFHDAGEDTGLLFYTGERPPAVLVPPAPDEADTLRRQFAAFVRAVMSGRPPEDAPPEAARAALALALRIERLLETVHKPR